MSGSSGLEAHESWWRVSYAPPEESGSITRTPTSTSTRGPGALVHVRATQDYLEPARLDGIILTHKHLDHANDVNVMVEAMTESGHKRKGVLFCPADAIGEDAGRAEIRERVPGRESSCSKKGARTG